MFNADVLVIDGDRAIPYSLLCLLKRHGYRLVARKDVGRESELPEETSTLTGSHSLETIRIPRLSPMALIHLLDYLQEDEALQPIYVLSSNRDQELIDSLHDHGCDDLLMEEDDTGGDPH